MADATNPIPRITRDDPAAGSGDVVAENISALKALFPAIVSDGKVDFDVLRQLLGSAVEDGAERYGLNWKGKTRARAFALTPSLGTLRPAKADSKEWDTTKNMVIEGDNLEVLKLLRKSYANKVKLIYIDPPYNTGKDFIYPDNYADSLSNYEMLTGQRGEEGARLTSNKETSGRFHADWLTMMYPRLMLARDLLRDDGLLMISVDDYEYERIALVGAELFGEEAHVGTFVWKRKAGGGDDSDHIAAEHEYIAVFAKDQSRAGIANILHESPAMTAKYNRSENGRRYYLERLDKTSLNYNASMDFKIDAPDGATIYPPQPNAESPTTIWRWGKDAVETRRGELTFLKDRDGEWRVYTRTWESLDGVTPRSLMADKSHGRNRDGTQELEDLLGPKVFPNPKPTKMLSHLLQISAKGKNDIVLDFFAGSGTTAHALMLKNASDNGQRRFIMVQFPQVIETRNPKTLPARNFLQKLGRPSNIAELTKERLRRAGEKVKADNAGAEVDSGFRVYKLTTSNLKPWQPGLDLAADLLGATSNVLPGRTEDDLLVELLLKTGIDLALPCETRTIAGRTVYSLGGGTLIVCLTDIPAANAQALGDGISDWLSELIPPAPTTFFFKDSGFDAGGNRAAEARANLAATLRQRLGEGAIEKLGAI